MPVPVPVPVSVSMSVSVCQRLCISVSGTNVHQRFAHSSLVFWYAKRKGRFSGHCIYHAAMSVHNNDLSAMHHMHDPIKT